jgi:long-chain acyl-CoA synthetase
VSKEASVRQTLATLVDDFERHGNQTAVVVRRGLRTEKHMYSELAALSRRFAHELGARGIQKGDRVLIWGPNGAQWVAAFFGCILQGVIAVPLDDAGSVEFARRVEAEVAPKLIVASAEHASALNSLSATLTLDGLDTSITARAHPSPRPDLSEDDPFQIVFTSGTTGDPKGIVHTHRNVLASLRPIEREIGKYARYERIFHPLRFLHTLPLSHVFGQFMGLWIPPMLAAEIHFEDRLLGSELTARIRRERISVLAAVPRVLDILRQYVLRRFPDLERRRTEMKGAKVWKRWWAFRDVHRALGFKFWALVCGGAALPADIEEFWNSLGFLVVQGYGMTETTALVSLNHPFRASKGTLGQVLPGREIQLTPEGEVLVRGETVSQKIWRGGGLQQLESEWLPTGDLAELDEAGNLRFRGRKKDVIVTAAGLNIHPDDLEAALSKQPEVKACTVVETVGVRGPEPLAVVVLRSGQAPDAVARANRELADFQQIRRWSVWPEPDLPRSSTGKVLRREVARIVNSSQPETEAVTGSLPELLKRIKQTSGSADAEAAGTGDLQLDSLGRVELQAGLEEQFGIVVDDAAIQNVRSVDDLRAYLSQSAASPPPAEEAGARDKHVYPHWPWAAPMKWIRVLFLELVVRPLVYVLARPRVKIASSAKPDAPMLLYANHVTSVDVPLMLYALPAKLRRRVAVAMSGEILLAWRERRYYRYRVLNWLSNVEYFIVTALFNVFPLPQKSGFRRSFAHAAEAMDRGYNVIVFPEGRRADDERIQPFQSGAGLLWNDLHCPALPVYLGGLAELKRSGERWLGSGKLSIYVGDVLLPAAGMSAEQATAKLEAALRDAAAAMNLGHTRP